MLNLYYQEIFVEVKIQDILSLFSGDESLEEGFQNITSQGNLDKINFSLNEKLHISIVSLFALSTICDLPIIKRLDQTSTRHHLYDRWVW